MLWTNISLFHGLEGFSVVRSLYFYRFSGRNLLSNQSFIRPWAYIFISPRAKLDIPGTIPILIGQEARLTPTLLQTGFGPSHIDFFGGAASALIPLVVLAIDVSLSN